MLGGRNRQPFGILHPLARERCSPFGLVGPLRRDCRFGRSNRGDLQVVSRFGDPHSRKHDRGNLRCGFGTWSFDVQRLRFAGVGCRRDLDYVRCRAFPVGGRLGTTFASPAPSPAAATAPSVWTFRIAFLLSAFTLASRSIFLVDELRTLRCRFFGRKRRRLVGSGERFLAAVPPTPTPTTTTAAFLLALLLLPLSVHGFGVVVDLVRRLFDLGRLR